VKRCRSASRCCWKPIHVVEIVCPTDATAKINAILSGRRGQILGFDTREGWTGWDRVRAMMPESRDRRVDRGSCARRPRAPAASPGSSIAWPKSPAAPPIRFIAAHRVAA